VAPAGLDLLCFPADAVSGERAGWVKDRGGAPAAQRRRRRPWCCRPLSGQWGGGERGCVVVGGVPQCGLVWGQRLAAVIPSGFPRLAGRGGMGRSACGQQDQSEARPRRL